jgi:hypothetical protein
MPGVVTNDKFDIDDQTLVISHWIRHCCWKVGLSIEVLEVTEAFIEGEVVANRT